MAEQTFIKVDLDNYEGFIYSELGIELGRLIMKCYDKDKVVWHKNLNMIDYRKDNLEVISKDEAIKRIKKLK